MSSVLPSLFVPESEKNEKWYNAILDYYFSNSNHLATGQEITECYHALDGIINADYYRHISNPYNSQDNRWNNMPAKVKYFNIIEPVVMSYLGELAKEPDMIRITSTNADVNNEYMAKLASKINKESIQDFINQVNAMQQGKEAESPDYEGIVKREEKSFKSRRTINCYNAWEYFKQYLNYKDLAAKYTLDYLTTGRAFTYKTVRNGQVFEEVVPPHELTAFLSPNSNRVSDGSAVVRVRWVTLSEVIDFYGQKYIKEADLINMQKDLNNHLGSVYQMSSSIDHTSGVVNLSHNQSTDSEKYANLIRVVHVQWKGARRVGLLTYLNEIGMETTIEVPDSYQLDPSRGDISLEYIYINWGYEHYMFGDRTYGKIHEMEFQRHEADNPSQFKLHYDGVVNRTRSGIVKSIVKTGMPYQALFNIYSFRIEMMMAVNKDKLLLLPKGLKPKNWKFDEWMYHIYAMRTVFIDETNDKISLLVQAIKDIDLSLGNYIGEMVNLVSKIKQDWQEAVGFNRQRMGDVYASDGKGTTGEAIYRSSMITSEYTRMISSFLREDVTGIIDLSKFAWRDGFTARFNDSKGRSVMLELEGDDWQETVFDVFVRNSASEVEKVQTVKQLLQPMAQNDMAKGIIAKIIDEDNYEKIVDLMEEADQIASKYLAEQEKQRSETTKYVADKQAETFDKELQMRKYEADSKYKTSVDSARITAITSLLGGATKDGDGDGQINDALAVVDNPTIAEAFNPILNDYMTTNNELTLQYEKIKTDRMKALKDSGKVKNK